MPTIMIDKPVTAVRYGDMTSKDDVQRDRAREGMSALSFPAGWTGDVSDWVWASVEQQGAGHLVEGE